MEKTMTPGFVTPEGTGNFSARFPGKKEAGYFREARSLRLSSVGLGTYLGEPDDVTDTISYRAAEECLTKGINVIDSAINYRAQRSERVIGKAVGNLITAGKLKREEVFISTKGGFIPFDSEYPDNPSAYFKKAFLEPGILKPEDVVQGCHAMTPKYLENQLDKSLENLALEAIDLYYVHNPETQLEGVSASEFYVRLANAFELLEKKVSEGKIKMYGLATWNGFRITSTAKGYLSFQSVLETAERAGGKSHHFSAIQLPYNLGMPEAFTNQNQLWESEAISAIEFAKRAGVMVFTSASLLQGKLTHGLPEQIKPLFPGCPSDAARVLQFVRSTPGVTTALVGMKSTNHISENLAVSDVTPLSANSFAALFTQKPS